jgi:hypothetical protein
VAQSLQNSSSSVLHLSRSQVLALTSLGIAGSINLGVLPLLVGAFSDQLHLTIRETGALATMEYLGGGVGALAAGWLIHRINWRVAISIVCIVAMLLTLLGAAVHTLLLVATLRLLNAAALGFIYAIGVFGIGRSQQPDRFFGVFFALQLIAYAVTAYAAPTALGLLGVAGLLACTAAWLVIPLILIRAVPSSAARADTPSSFARTDGAISTGAVVSAFGLLLFMLSVHGIWALVERLGVAEQIPTAAIDAAITSSSLTGAAGSILATLSGVRFGRLLPAGLAVISVAIGFGFLVTNSPASYIFGVNLYSAGWLLGMSYFMGQTATMDSSDRVTRLMPLIQLGAGSIAPNIAAWLATWFSFRTLALAAAGAAIAGYILLAAAVAIYARPPHLSPET